MRGLTLWQPWASAIAHGGKDIENRPWPCPDAHLGTRIAIHAGKHYDANGAYYVRERWPEMPSKQEIPYGAIVSVVTVARLERCSRDLARVNAWAFGPWCWLLTDITPLETPPLLPRQSQSVETRQGDRRSAHGSRH